MTNIAMTTKEFEEKIKTISDKELQNRIKQSNKKSNVYQMLIREAGNRVVKIYIEGDL